MELLKQTALILGLVALTIGVWTLFRHWRNRISVLFSFLCFLVSVWALSFVSHATLFGRLSYDIHLFCNVLLAPAGVLLMSNFLVRKINAFSRWLFLTSLVGGAFLCFLIVFSLGKGEWFRLATGFWPSFILLEYFHLLFLEARRNPGGDSAHLPKGRRMVLYLGPILTLAFCTFDHIPAMGTVMPAIGNLLFAVYLGFASQIINPRKLFGLDSLVSRFLAVLTLSLILTGFFALLYNNISRSFPLFLLNSFLISFAVLALWSPLVTFFRLIGRRLFPETVEEERETVERFRILLSAVTSLEDLQEGLRQFFMKTHGAERVEIALDPSGLVLPVDVESYCQELREKGLPPVLHRSILEQERDAWFTREGRRSIEMILEFLDAGGFDGILPAWSSEKTVALIRVRLPVGRESAATRFFPFPAAPELMNELGDCVCRLARIGEARERERLILLGEMAAGLAHEIRNPLGSIRGAADLLRDSGPFVDVIRDETARLNRLVGQFLDFSRNPQDGRQRVDLCTLIPRAITNTAFLLPSKVRLRFEGREAPVPVEVVPDSIQQVLSNLIQNSVKALEGVPDAEIVVCVEESGFSVTDNGIGMVDSVRARVLEPFFTSSGNGTGLGLSICERLIRFDRGWLKLDSTPGRGTRVEVGYPDAR
jgi:two-component system sensor histidine kinase HydH